MTTKIKAVAYYRMSSDKQEASIADQRTAVEKYAADNGYKITGEYLDEGISGWKSGDQRNGFQRLIAAAERKEFQAVLCWDQDRFSRFPILEANHYWYLLDRAGVHIATVAQGRLRFEDLGEWLKASVTQHGKSEFLKDLSRNVVRGLRKAALAGRWTGNAPMGYLLDAGRLVLGDTEEIETVRKIFALRVRGYGLRAIAVRLNDAGNRAARGGLWCARGVHHILARDAYIGNRVVGKNPKGKYERITDDLITVEKSHPAIIDQSTWDSVRAMETKPRLARGKGEGAPLAGLLKCGRCGNPMYAVAYKGREHYVCGDYHRKGKCGFCQVLREPILQAVTAKIRQHILLGSVEQLESEIQRQLDRRKEPKQDTASMVRKLAALDQQIARASDRLLIVDDSLVADLEQRVLAMRRQRDELTASLGSAPSPRRLPSAKTIASKAWELDRILAGAPATTVRNALQPIIEEIRLEFRAINKPSGRKRYEFARGVIRLVSNGGHQVGRMPCSKRLH